jgi:hypothetical protein
MWGSEITLGFFKSVCFFSACEGDTYCTLPGKIPQKFWVGKNSVLIAASFHSPIKTACSWQKGGWVGGRSCRSPAESLGDLPGAGQRKRGWRSMEVTLAW